MRLFIIFQLLIAYFITIVESYDVQFENEVTKGIRFYYFHNIIMMISNKIWLDFKKKTSNFLVYVPWEKFLHIAKQLTDQSGQQIALDFFAVNDLMKQALYAQDLDFYIENATKALWLAKRWRSHVKNIRILEAANQLIDLYEFELDKKNCKQLRINKVRTILEKTYEIVTTC